MSGDGESVTHTHTRQYISRLTHSECLVMVNIFFKLEWKQSIFWYRNRSQPNPKL